MPILSPGAIYLDLLPFTSILPKVYEVVLLDIPGAAVVDLTALELVHEGGIGIELSPCILPAVVAMDPAQNGWARLKPSGSLASTAPAPALSPIASPILTILCTTPRSPPLGTALVLGPGSPTLTLLKALSSSTLSSPSHPSR